MTAGLGQEYECRHREQQHPRCRPAAWPADRWQQAAAWRKARRLIMPPSQGSRSGQSRSGQAAQARAVRIRRQPAAERRFNAHGSHGEKHQRQEKPEGCGSRAGWSAHLGSQGFRALHENNPHKQQQEQSQQDNKEIADIRAPNKRKQEHRGRPLLPTDQTKFSPSSLAARLSPARSETIRLVAVITIPSPSP